MKMFKIVFLLVAALFVAGLIFAFKLRVDMQRPLTITEPMFLSVKSGDTLLGVSAKLKEQGIVRSEKTLLWVDRLYGPKSILAADYSIELGTTVIGLYEALTEGKSIAPDKQVTIVEGLTLDQIADVLVEAGIVASKEAFITAATDEANTFSPYSILAHKPPSASLEGYLFPDTYRFFPNSEPDVVIRKMLSTLNQRFTYAELEEMILGSGRNIHEIMTLASIVEREVQSDDDMATVAGLFMNRLSIGMPLQADSTIGYITKSGLARSTFKDLEIESPYNTYKYRGLPPGPISNPGWRAISAVLNPAENNYLFFLTDKNGKVYYAEDLAGHNDNRRFLEGVK